MKATHQAIVIELHLEKHPNADALSIAKVNDVFQVVLRTEDWIGETKAIYIPPQNLVDTDREEFAWLKKDGERWALVKPVKLRGVHSYGLCVKCPEGFDVGEDVTEYLNIQHYEPEHQFMGTNFTNGGALGSSPKYDVDSVFKKLKFWSPDDIVHVSEKIHGQNMRVYWDGETLHVGGRNKWFEEDSSLYWRVIRKYPQIKRFCQAYPNHILYGEQYGHTNLKYGADKLDVGFAAFDIRRPDLTFLNWLEAKEILDIFGVPTIRTLYYGKFGSYDELAKFSVGDTTYNDSHIREGCVVKTTVEERDEEGDRKIFKIINPDYKG